MNLPLLALYGVAIICFLPHIYLFTIFLLMAINDTICDKINRLYRIFMQLIGIIYDIIINFPVISFLLVILLFRRKYFIVAQML